MKQELEKAKILLVDDVPGNIKTLKAILGRDYKLFISTTGQGALEIATSRAVDLILLDVIMPEMDGFEVCRRLKANATSADIPIIFVTAKHEETDETKGFELGAVDYITKPISPAIVQARVRTQIRIRTLNRSLEHSNHFIRKTFGRYMSDEVVESILNTPEGLRLGGEKKEVTVMMSDLRGFTNIGETLAPEEVISMLNMYLKTMTEIILKYKGTIIEFLGDGILALFGAPVTRDDDADRAVACVLEMQLAMPSVNATNRQHGFPEVTMGCGVNTGQVVAGNIGSDLRSKYGVVGNAINLAARIESFTVGGQILVSESTKQACRAQLRVDNQWPVRAKGVREGFTIYEVGGIQEPYHVQRPPPKPSVLQPISHAPSVHLIILEGKRADQTSHAGQIIAIQLPVVVISTDLLVRRLTNLQIELQDHNGQTISHQIYGKVIDENQEDFLKVQFTAIPKVAENFLQEFLPNQPL